MVGALGARCRCPCRRRGSSSAKAWRTQGSGAPVWAENLPLGWESAWDPCHQCVYYFNRATGDRSWLKPDAMYPFDADATSFYQSECVKGHSFDESSLSRISIGYVEKGAVNQKAVVGFVGSTVVGKGIAVNSETDEYAMTSIAIDTEKEGCEASDWRCTDNTITSISVDVAPSDDDTEMGYLGRSKGHEVSFSDHFESNGRATIHSCCNTRSDADRIVAASEEFALHGQIASEVVGEREVQQFENLRCACASPSEANLNGARFAFGANVGENIKLADSRSTSRSNSCVDLDSVHLQFAGDGHIAVQLTQGRRHSTITVERRESASKLTGCDSTHGPQVQIVCESPTRTIITSMQDAPNSLKSDLRTMGQYECGHAVKTKRELKQPTINPTCAMRIYANDEPTEQSSSEPDEEPSWNFSERSHGEAHRKFSVKQALIEKATDQPSLQILRLGQEHPSINCSAQAVERHSESNDQIPAVPPGEGSQSPTGPPQWCDFAPRRDTTTKACQPSACVVQSNPPSDGIVELANTCQAPATGLEIQNHVSITQNAEQGVGDILPSRLAAFPCDSACPQASVVTTPFGKSTCVNEAPCAHATLQDHAQCSQDLKTGSSGLESLPSCIGCDECDTDCSNAQLHHVIHKRCERTAHEEMPQRQLGVEHVEQLKNEGTRPNAARSEAQLYALSQRSAKRTESEKRTVSDQCLDTLFGTEGTGALSDGASSPRLSKHLSRKRMAKVPSRMHRDASYEANHERQTSLRTTRGRPREATRGVPVDPSLKYRLAVHEPAAVIRQLQVPNRSRTGGRERHIALDERAERAPSPKFGTESSILDTEAESSWANLSTLTPRRHKDSSMVVLVEPNVAESPPAARRGQGCVNELALTPRRQKDPSPLVAENACMKISGATDFRASASRPLVLEENSHSSLSCPPQMHPSTQTQEPLSPVSSSSGKSPKAKGRGKNAPPVCAPPGKGKGGGKGNKEAEFEPRKKDVTPGVALKKLFWNRICLDGARSDDHLSIWEKIHEARIDFNMTELEHLFAEAANELSIQPKIAIATSTAGSYECDDPPSPTPAKSPKNQIAPTPLVRRRLLEEKRRRQIWFALAIMPSIPDVLDAVVNMDDAVLLPEKVELLLYNLPSAEEEQILTKAPGLAEDECWDAPEDFMMRLIKIPKYAFRIQVWAFLNSIEACGSRLAKDCEELTIACELLQTSPRVERLLSLVLYVGNYLNGGTPRGRADGFDLDILPKLATLKASSAEKGVSYTLVDFLVQQAEQSWSGFLRDMFSPGMEFEAIRKAKRHRATVLKDEVMGLIKQAEGHLRKLQEYGLSGAVGTASAGGGATSSSPSMPKGESDDHCVAHHRVEMVAQRLAELQEMNANLDTFQGKYARLCLWFRDRDKSRHTDEFFCLWDRFLEDTKKALDAWDRRRASENARPASARRFTRQKSVGVIDECGRERSTGPSQRRASSLVGRRGSLNGVEARLRRTTPPRTMGRVLSQGRRTTTTAASSREPQPQKYQDTSGSPEVIASCCEHDAR